MDPEGYNTTPLIIWHQVTFLYIRVRIACEEIGSVWNADTK